MAARPRTKEPPTRGAEAVLEYCMRNGLAVSDFARDIAGMAAGNFHRLLYEPTPNAKLQTLRRIRDGTDGYVRVQWWLEPPRSEKR